MRVSRDRTESCCQRTFPQLTPPLLAMPRCPSCSKILPSDEAIQRHMNQPASRCHRWVDDLVRLSEIDEIEAVHNPHLSEIVHSPQENWTSPSPGRFDGMDGTIDRDPSNEFVEEFPGAAKIFQDERNTFLHKFDQDRFSNERQENLYYPFSSRSDWEFGLWLTRSGLSLAAIDSLLSLELVSPLMYISLALLNGKMKIQIKCLPISFRTAKQLRGLIELLPSGPKWQYHVMKTAIPTKSPVRLFYRDSVECLEALFEHPLFHDKLDLVPRRVYRSAERLVRVYSEWMTGDVAWDIQVRPLSAGEF